MLLPFLFVYFYSCSVGISVQLFFFDTKELHHSTANDVQLDYTTFPHFFFVFFGCRCCFCSSHLLLSTSSFCLNTGAQFTALAFVSWRMQCSRCACHPIITTSPYLSQLRTHSHNREHNAHTLNIRKVFGAEMGKEKIHVKYAHVIANGTTMRE